MERGYPYLVKKHLPCAGAAVAFLLLFILARPAEAQSAFVRVNQVGYITSASKRAYLMSSGSEAGAAFQVKNSTGATAFSAPIGANQGSWSIQERSRGVQLI